MKISVLMITYNHEKFIAEAIQGVLMQDIGFEMEVVIANDCSKDATDTVIKDIINTHPKGYLITYINNPKNLGMNVNFKQALKHCQGQYIALCEGDDYWIDRFKLQKQVDFLERNLEYSYCGHQSFVLENDVLNPMYIKTGELVLEDVIIQNTLNTASLALRHSIIQDLPPLFVKAKAGDWILQLIALKYGKAFVMEDFMSVYRKHESSVWSSLNSKVKGQLGIDNMMLAKSFFNDNKQISELIDEAILLRQKKFGLEKKSKWKRIKDRFLK